MDTKLKKGKQIRAMVYRAVSFGLLVMTLFAVTTGYKALQEFFVNQHYQLIWGDITGVTEFQEYIGSVYNNGMIAFTGVGDDKGYPLEDSGSSSIKDQATIDFYNAAADSNGALLYYVYDHNYKEKEGEYDSRLHTNFTNPIFSEYDGHLILPGDVDLMFHRSGPNHTLTSNSYLNLDYTKYSYMPNEQKAQEMDFVLAVKMTDLTDNDGTIGELARTARDYRDQLRFLVISVFLLVISWIFVLATVRTGRTAKKNVTDVTAHILLEIKMVFLIVILFAALPIIRHPFTFTGERALVRAGLLAVLAYPVLLDLKTNALRLFQCWIPVLIYRYVKEWGQNQPWKKRLSVYAGVTGIGALLCGGIDVVLVLHLQDSLKNLTKAKALKAFFNTAADARGSGYQELLAIFWISMIGIVLLGFCIYHGARFFKEVTAVTDKLSNIRNGKLNSPLPVVQGAYLAQTVDDVNMLESGIENAVDLKSRADRMKVELITNVSHDLKTPLTSIINYVDLLCEEDMSPAAQDYVLALRDKSYKLKAMVQDVFEVSKASTGNMNVEKVVLDLGKLIRQTLADMDERIAESNLTFKMNLPQEPVYIEGDSEKLYRVYQNLFVNALQYSLDYSRVHVGLAVQEGVAVTTVKNTSRGELNFDTQEITERFVRADASRTTEGSGLGLSIAKSFTEACGGEFSVETDADMFIAIVKFSVVEKPMEEKHIEQDSIELDSMETPSVEENS